MANGLASLPYELRSLGLISGVFDQTMENPGLNEAWFSGPFSLLPPPEPTHPVPPPTLANLFSDATRVETLLQLLQRLLEPTSNGDAPTPLQGECWFPPRASDQGNAESTSAPTFHLVTDLSDVGLQLGVGFGFSETLDKEETYRLSIQAKIPLLYAVFDDGLGAPSFRFPYRFQSRDGGPGYARLEVRRTQDITLGPLTVRGFRLELNIPLDGAPQLEVTLLGLEGVDEMPLSDLGEADVLLPLLLAGLVSAVGNLEEATGDEASTKATLQHIVALLGLGPDLPAMPWQTLVDNKAGKVLLEWFNTLGTTEGAFALWMGHWQALVWPSKIAPGTDKKVRAAGEGTRATPWRVDLPGLEGGALAFTLARELSSDGIARLIPGFLLDGPPFNAGASSKAPRFGISLLAELLELPLPAASGATAAPITPLPKAQLALSMRSPAPGTALVEHSKISSKEVAQYATVTSIRLDQINAGVELRRLGGSSSTGSWAFKPLIELLNVSYSAVQHSKPTTGQAERVDLSSLRATLLSFPTLMRAILAAVVGNSRAASFGTAMAKLLEALGIQGANNSPAMPQFDESKLKTYLDVSRPATYWLRDRLSRDNAPKTIKLLVELFNHSKVSASTSTLLSYKPNGWLELQFGRKDKALLLDFVLKGVKLGPLELNAVEKDAENKEIPRFSTLSIQLPDPPSGKEEAIFGVGFQLELSLSPSVVKLGGTPYCPIIGARYGTAKGEDFCLDAWPVGRTQGKGFRLKLFPSFEPDGDVGEVVTAVAPVLILLLLEIDALAEWLTETKVFGMSLLEMVKATGLLPKVEKGEPEGASETTSATGRQPELRTAALSVASNAPTLPEPASMTFIDEMLSMLMGLVADLGTKEPFLTLGDANSPTAKFYYSTLDISPLHLPTTRLHGVRMELTPLELVASKERDGKAEGLELELGWHSETDASWIGNATDVVEGGRKPGIGLYLFERSADAAADAPWIFHPWLDLVSLELNLNGPGEDGPLVDLDVFRLGALKLQFFLALDFGIDAGNIRVPAGGFGAWLQLTDLGVSIAAGFEGKNPVAQYLLDGKASKEGEPKEGEDSAAVIPQFNLGFSYRDKFRVHLGDPSVDGEAAKDGDEQVLWFPIHKKLGPLYVLQLGVRQWKEADQSEWLSLVLDAGVEVGPLAIQVDDLSVDIPLKQAGSPKHWEADLKGLAVSIDADGFRLTGGLRKTGSGENLSYDGLCIVEAGGRTVSALGSYTKVEGEASFFAFVVLPIPLGGPPMFFVEGLALGFGYNRSLVVPGIDKIAQRDFMLLKALGEGTPKADGASSSSVSSSTAVSPSNPGGTPSATGVNRTAELIRDNPKQALGDFRAEFLPVKGAFFLAVGLDFTSFKLVRTQAVIYVLINKGFELGLVGVSKLALPEDADKPLVNIELALQLRFSTQLGRLSIEALLTDKSYLLDEACKLTGGFAFYLWFAGVHAGDFVISIGGYHPRFKKPDHYPIVPRLGFHWSLSKTVTLKGEAYFALTPACVMAGGRLEAIFQSGGVRAWFIAGADFLISWKPFYYDIEIYVSIGAEVRFEILGIDCKLKIELGARLWLWGPPFAGEVEVDLCVVSITIPLGSGKRQELPPLSWDTFTQTLLPPHNPYPKPGEGKPSSLYKVQVERGLFEEVPLETGEAHASVWVLRNEFSLGVETLIPYTALRVQGQADTSQAEREELIIDLFQPVGTGRADIREASIQKPWASQIPGIQYAGIGNRGASLDFKQVPELRSVDGQTSNGPTDGKTRRYQVDIRPMAWVNKPEVTTARDIVSTLTVTLERLEPGQSVRLDDLRMLEITVIEQNVPAALWDASYGSKSPESRTVPLPAGVRIEAVIRESELDATGHIPLADLRDVGPNAKLPFAQEVADRVKRSAALDEASRKRGNQPNPQAAWDTKHPTTASRARRYRRAPPIQEEMLKGVVAK